MIASVLLEIKAKSVDKTFDYIIPNVLKETLKIGVRVSVPFGNQKLQGYVLDIKEDRKENYELKEILCQLDEEIILNKELLLIGKKIKELTLSSLSSAYSTMLPSALKARKNNHTTKKYEFYLCLNCSVEEANLLCKNKVQKEIISLFDSNITISKKEANEISASAVKTLLKKEILIEKKEECYRLQIGLEELEPKKTLTKEQKKAYEEMILRKTEATTILLHGVTGSGKTEVYMQVIEEIIKENKQALVLVPEISLTPQFIQNFTRRFGTQIAVLHSALSIGEKYDEWRKIMRGECNIVIGARSAIFAPLEKLGIIIIDECHSDSYKQENKPKYHVLDIANFRSQYHKCPVILGSATPTLEIMARAKKGLFHLVTLTKRAQNNTLPKCILVNKKEEIKKGNFLLSEILEQKITERLEKKEQVMILLNRRGHSTLIQCSSCGFVYKCPYCDITLTFHKSTKNLRCHYCGYTKYLDDFCPECKEESLNYYGLGTEKLESKLKEKFPNANIARMDTDTTSKKGTLETLMKSFQEKKYDILIGTQMISKGLDFPAVTLVGILNADMTLNIPDFRSSEKTFALLYQASGRAGRSTIPGEVIIETFNPDNKVLNFVQNQDYTGFYHYEMQVRKLLKYPPFYYIAHLTIKSKDYELARNESKKVSEFLRKNLDKDTLILGPTTANMFRINNVYHFEIMIKYRFDKKLKDTLKELEQIFMINKKIDLDIDMND